MRSVGRAVTAATLRRKLRAHANPANVPVLQSFFKTGRAEYGEGDVFIGVKTPGLRAVCRECRGAPLDQLLTLLRSRVHEERMLALVMLGEAFVRGTPREQQQIYAAYLANTTFINNWDLVDASADRIVGAWLRTRPRGPLLRLARSKSVWERRMAILATFHYIKQGELDETLRIADLLLEDRHDLIHKAVGWMLREVGKRDGAALRRFLAPRYRRMPRTMLRYAIERFPPRERRRYLAGSI